ncbi:MAG: hypothetical protein ABI723_16030 [Bacteroidia bacterium]
MKKINVVILASIFALAAMLTSCKKYEEEVVKDNNAPPDETISGTAIENYVNKTYISLLGREPDSLELASGISNLKAHNLSSADRDGFLNQVLAKTDYTSHLFNISNNDLLNNLDTNEITEKIYIFTFLMTDSAYLPFWGTLQFEIDRLVLMQQIATKLQNGTASVIDLHHTFIDNYFYDQINMGSLNYVVSMYQNFLRRYPTENELNAGIAMVDGNYAIVFSQTGHSKVDFANIFFSSNDYYEGQVRDLYLRYLFREPTSTESSTLTIQYKNSGNYKQLQKAILSTNEFIGI